MTYPAQFLKGIPNKSFIGNDNGPTSDLFYFLLEHQKENRKDDYLEESICWRDDELSDSILLSQRKENGNLQFTVGAAVMCRLELDSITKKPLVKGFLDYERKEVPGNKYHGNLLLHKNVQTREMKKIAATIANMCFIEIVPNTNT